MTTSDDARPRLRVRSVEESLGVIPHLLGFHPAESLVVMVVDSGVVAVTARVDLAEVAAPGGVETVLRRIWARFPAADAWFVAYTADHGLGWEVLARCNDFLGAPAFRRLTLVDGDTWFSDSPDGPSGSHDPRASPLAAEAAFHGLVARRSRADLEDCLSGPPEHDTVRLREIADAVGQELAARQTYRWPALMGEILQRLDPGRGIDDTDAATLALLAVHPDARDVALLAISRTNADHHLALWRAVVNRTLGQHQGHALVLTGLAAWISGEGALASMCLERAERQVPECWLVGILAHLIEAVVPPSVWDDLRPDLVATAKAPIRRALPRPASRRRR